MGGGGERGVDHWEGEEKEGEEEHWEVIFQEEAELEDEAEKYKEKWWHKRHAHFPDQPAGPIGRVQETHGDQGLWRSILTWEGKLAWEVSSEERLTCLNFCSLSRTKFPVWITNPNMAAAKRKVGPTCPNTDRVRMAGWANSL